MLCAPVASQHFEIGLRPAERDGDGHSPCAFKHPTNELRTFKYTPINFLPKFLWEAYHHISNVYFTVDLLIQVRPPPPSPAADRCCIGV